MRRADDKTDLAQASDPALAPPPLRRAVPRTALRIALLVVIAVIFNMAVGWLLTQITSLNSISGAAGMAGLLIAALLGYAVLIAIPFMPGIEVGIALLLLQGAAIAPFVYLATVAGLFLAYVIGRQVPLKMLHNAFRDLHMRRACELILNIDRTPTQDRLHAMQARLPRPLAALVVNYRYVMIAALINIPGTFAIGGGGGILMFAGITRLFRWPAILLTLAIATLPVPLIVWLWGTEAIL